MLLRIYTGRIDIIDPYNRLVASYMEYHPKLMDFLRSDEFVALIPKVETIALSCPKRKYMKKLIPLFETALETMYVQHAPNVTVEVTECPEMSRQNHKSVNRTLDQYDFIKQCRYKVSRKPLSDAPAPSNEMIRLSHKVNHIMLEGNLFLLGFFEVFTIHPACKVNGFEMTHVMTEKTVPPFRQKMDELLTQIPNDAIHTLNVLKLKDVCLVVGGRTDLSVWSLPKLSVLHLEGVTVRDNRDPKSLQENSDERTLCGSHAADVRITTGEMNSSVLNYIKFFDSANVAIETGLAPEPKSSPIWV